MKRVASSLFMVASGLVLLFLGAVNPPSALAVPSYARQTGLACSGCHYAPPELNPAGRRFKLLGYVDKADDTKTIQKDGSKKSSALDLLASLPLSVMLDTSFTATKSQVPGTQNGSFEFPQDISLFLSGAWTSHVGSFVQVTFSGQSGTFGADNTDIRFANKTKMGGKELVYGLDLNNNPTVEDLWNSTPAWAFPSVAADSVPTPAANPLINSGMAQNVAGFGGYAMWDSHLYLDVAVYRSEHIGSAQPNDGSCCTLNIHGAAPYWRMAWQQLTGKTQYEIGTYGMHLRSTPNRIVDPITNTTGLEDSYTDVAFDTQIDRTLFRTDVLSFRGTFIHENSDLLASLNQGMVGLGPHHLNTFLTNAEYHIGNKYTGTFGWFDTAGSPDMVLYAQSAVGGSANGKPRSAGYIANITYWPWQNLELAAQYTGYTRFNGGSTNYDGANRNASSNNAIYVDMKVIF
jgi:hypothetical protein